MSQPTSQAAHSSSADPSADDPSAPQSRVDHAQRAQMNPQVWAFGGAKGGVGRSVICALTACELVRRGYRVILVDFDLGSANLHTLLGVMQPKNNLEQWILGRVQRLDEVCSPTLFEGLSLISGASSIYNPSHPTEAQLKRVIHEALQLEADYILIDLGAGIHPHTLDFFNVAGQSFIITSPEPTSIQNSYAFYRAALLRRLEVTLNQNPWLEKILRRASLSKGDARITSLGQLLDMVRELNYELSREVKAHLQSLRAPLIINRAYPDDEKQVKKALSSVCGQYLQIKLTHALTIPEDKLLRGAVRSLKPLHLLEREAPINLAISAWIDDAVGKGKYTPIHEDFLPLVGQPSFLSSHPEGATRRLPVDQTPKPRSQQEALLMGAIEALNEVDQRDAAIAAQTGSLTAQAGGLRDWKSVAWEQPSPDARVIQEAVYGDTFEELPTLMPQAEPPHAHTQELNEAQHALRYENMHPTLLSEPVMSDPPEHEVVCLEEEVRSDLGWLHLKTADLAPFHAAIRTSIYLEGERVVCQEKSYQESLERGLKGTDLLKRVERVHHESADLLKRGGIEAWRAHHSVAAH